MGEAKPEPLRVDFDCRLKLEFPGSKITSDAGLLAYRELDDVLGLTDLGGAALSDLRRGKNTRHLLTGLLRQSVYGRLAGYEDVNDAERLSLDPAMRAIVDCKGALIVVPPRPVRWGASKRSGWQAEENFAVLNYLPGAWIDRVHDRKDTEDHQSSTWTAPSARPTVVRRAPPTTAISGVPAITLFSCSTSSAILSDAPCAPATSIALMAGATFWNTWSPGIGIAGCGATSEAMQPLPHRISMSSWKPRATSTPSVSRPTRFFRKASSIC